MTKEEHDKRVRRGIGYGLLGYFGGIYGGAGSVIGPDFYRARKKWQKQWGGKPKKSYNPMDFNEYWKKNPQAKKFYDHKMKKGELKAAQNLLRKLGKKGKFYYKQPPLFDRIDDVMVSDRGFPYPSRINKNKPWGVGNIKVKKAFKNFRGAPFSYHPSAVFRKGQAIRIRAGLLGISGLTAGIIYGYSKKIKRNKR